MFFFFGTGEVALVVLIVLVGAATWYLLYRWSDDVRKKGLGVSEQQPDEEDARPPSAAAGWYPVEGGRRFWNGSEWTTPVIRAGRPHD